MFTQKGINRMKVISETLYSNINGLVKNKDAKLERNKQLYSSFVLK